jgi:hypothetical protein
VLDSVCAHFHALYLLAIILSVVSGIFGLIAGVALLMGKAVGRTLAVIAAFLSAVRSAHRDYLRGVYALATASSHHTTGAQSVRPG